VSAILVTGARGFVGRHVMACAAALGHRAVPAEGDLRDPATARAAVAAARPDAVLHLAGTSPARRREDPWAALTDDVRMAGNLVVAIAELAPAARLVVAGSAAQYGFGLDRPLAETDQTAPVNPYGLAKDTVERAVLDRTLSAGVSATAVRAFNHCGPGQGPDAPAAQWSRRLAELQREGGGVLRTGDLGVRRDFLDVRDVADAYLALATAGPDAAGPVNLCSGEATELRQVVELLIAAAGVEVELEVDPAFLRPDDPPNVVGDPTRLFALTDWRPRRTLEQSLGDQFHEHLNALETTPR
jgi:GDP-4-dehydro-6-deoxy-D-mannose reductase